jgi:hypothetical protein
MAMTSEGKTACKRRSWAPVFRVPCGTPREMNTTVPALSVMYEYQDCGNRT